MSDFWGTRGGQTAVNKIVNALSELTETIKEASKSVPPVKYTPLLDDEEKGTVTYISLLQEALGLKSVNGTNPEYDRALCTLIAGVIRTPLARTPEAKLRLVAARLGISIKHL